MFGDTSRGQDLRGLDAALITLAVSHGAQYAYVECSFNDTFRTGARAQLLEALLALEGRAAYTPSAFPESS